MSKLNPIWTFIRRNKYWIVIIAGVLITGVVDENSFMKRMKLEMQTRELKEQIQDYNAQYAKDQRELKALRTRGKAVSRIARERYFMKTDDEDIFVLSDELNNGNETTK